MTNIVFYIGYQQKNLDIDIHGINAPLGGSETCVIQLADRLADLGHNVYVVGQVETRQHLTIGSNAVAYYNTIDFRNQVKTGFLDSYFDRVIAINYIHYLHELNFITWGSSVFWLHNTEHFDYHNGRSLPNANELYSDPRMNLVVCVSEWQAEIVKQLYPSCESKVVVIDNGFETSLMTLNSKYCTQNNFIYASASDRGLERVLDIWTQLKSKLPDAKLRICCPSYSEVYTKEITKSYDGELQDVDFLYSLTKKELYACMEDSRFWLYPSDYTETFCITALEMCAHQIIPITGKAGNLNHLLNTLYANINLPNSDVVINSEQTLTSLVTRVLEIVEHYNVLDHQELNDKLSLVQERAFKYDWNHISKKWEDLVCLVTTDKLSNYQLIISLKDPNDENINHWTEQLAKANMVQLDGSVKFKVFPAINGNVIDEEYLLRNGLAVKNWKIESSNGWWNRDMLPGELGCALSHYIAWQQAKTLDVPYVVIYEDDFACIDDGYGPHQLTNEDLARLPCDWDMLYLGRNQLSPDKRAVSNNIVVPDHSYNMHAYALSRKGIDKLLQQNFNGQLMPVDEFIQCTYTEHPRHDLKHIWADSSVYAVKPNIFYQNDYDNTGSQTETIHLQQDSVPVGDVVNEPAAIVIDSKDHRVLDFFSHNDYWVQRYLAPGAADMDILLTVDEPIDHVYCWKMFSDKFCNDITQLAETKGKWTTDRHFFYPTTDMLLQEMEFNEIYNAVLVKYVEPIMRHCYQLDGKCWNNMHKENFIAKYTPYSQSQLKIHHDKSDISVLVNLSQPDVDFTGGGTYFPKYQQLYRPQKGSISIHPGNITHKHGARAVQSGTRYIMVSFMLRTKEE